jgi:hypothetical protein
MASSGILGRVALVRTDVSEELSATFIRVTRIGELGTTLAVTSNRRTLRAQPCDSLDVSLFYGPLRPVKRIFVIKGAQFEGYLAEVTFVKLTPFSVQYSARKPHGRVHGVFLNRKLTGG